LKWSPISPLLYIGQDVDRYLPLTKVSPNLDQLISPPIFKSNVCPKYSDEVFDLQNQKQQIEQFAFGFKNSHDKYLQIKRIAEEVVDRLLSERKSLLTSILVAVVEALRMNHDRYAIIYNSKYDNNNSDIFESSMGTMSAAISSSHSSTNVHQNHYYKEYHEGILEIAKTFFNSLLSQLVNKTMVEAAKEK
jgi:hypothetical protein